MTPEQIDRVLPRAATWPPRIYDMTDTDERREACEWVAGIVNAAETPANTEEDVRTTIEWLRSLRQSRDSAPESPESDENADRVSVDHRNDTGAHSGSVWRSFLEVPDGSGMRRYEAGPLVPDWPPPAHWAIPTQPSPPAPGITYHGRDDER